MNEHSLIKKMARAIDESKIEKIKEATIQLVVEQGYGGASVSKIAKKASVAEGYLYRHYKSKSDLIFDLLDKSMTALISQFEETIKQSTDLIEILENTVRILFEYTRNDMMRMKFMFVLMNDYNFSIAEELRQRTIEVCQQVIAVGRSKNQIDESIVEEDVYLLSISYTIQFINHRLKNFFGNTELDEEAVQKVLGICKKAMCKNN